MALAVSWNPLMKSKTSPMTTMRMSTKNAPLGILEYDSFHRVGDVLGVIGGVFEQLVELAPANLLDQLRDVFDTVVEHRQRLGESVVGLVLQPVDLNRAAKHLVRLLRVLQLGDGVAQQRCLLGDDLGHMSRVVGCLSDPIEPDPPAGLLDEIDEVVELGGEAANIFAVERGHEGRVEGVVDLMGNLVSAMLQLAQLADFALDIIGRFEDVAE